MATKDQIARVFEQFCEAAKFRCVALDEGVFFGAFRGKNGKWCVQIHVDSDQFHCYSILPVIVPPQKQPAVMEYLTRANYGLSMGNFEMDLSDGEVRYKTSLDLADGALTQGMVAALVFRNLLTTDHYLKGLLQVLVADQTPALSIQAGEATLDDEEPDADSLADLLDDVDLDPTTDPGDDEGVRTARDQS